MRISYRIRAAGIALLAGVTLFSASAADALRVEYAPGTLRAATYYAVAPQILKLNACK